MSTISERPGVYSTVEVTGTLGGGRSGKTVGLAAVSSKGTKGLCVRISSYTQAVEEFGPDCGLTKLAKVLFLNGAGAVMASAAAVGAAASTEDYTAAFKALMDQESVNIMVCDSSEAAVHNAMRQAILGGGESSKYRVGIVESTGTVAELTEKAGALNCERLALVCRAGGEDETCIGEAAAALAGVVASGSDPALPLNGAELFGVEHCSGRFSDGDVTALVQGGVTPVERDGESVSVVRGVTTRTSTGGEKDATWRELTTVLIIDDVIPTVRSALRIKFPRVKNTRQTRGAIRTQVIIELENKLKQEIIDSYDSVTAEADENDPTVCVVSFSFTVAHGLNRIRLTAHISV